MVDQNTIQTAGLIFYFSALLLGTVSVLLSSKYLYEASKELFSRNEKK